MSATWLQGCRELLLRDNCFCKAMAVSRAFIFHLKCSRISPYASFYAGLSCICSIGLPDSASLISVVLVFVPLVSCWRRMQLEVRSIQSTVYFVLLVPRWRRWRKFKSSVFDGECQSLMSTCLFGRYLDVRLVFVNECQEFPAQNVENQTDIRRWKHRTPNFVFSRPHRQQGSCLHSRRCNSLH